MENDKFEEHLAGHAELINRKLEEVLKKKSSTHYISSLSGRSNYEYDNEAIDSSALRDK